jgi:hypothetical protein
LQHRAYWSTKVEAVPAQEAKEKPEQIGYLPVFSDVVGAIMILFEEEKPLLQALSTRQNK